MSPLYFLHLPFYLSPRYSLSCCIFAFDLSTAYFWPFDLKEFQNDADGRFGLPFSIVSSAVGDIKPPVLHVVDETVFFVDAAAVFALQITREGFGFPDSFHTAVPFNILNELVDSL